MSRRRRRPWWALFRRRQQTDWLLPAPIGDGQDSTAALDRMRGNWPDWNGPTTRLPNVLPRENPSLMTPAAAWRSRTGGRWDALPPAGRP